MVSVYFTDGKNFYSREEEKIMEEKLIKNVEHRKAFKGAFVVALVAGTVVNYIVGVVMFCLLTHSSVMVGITACVLPFIPTAIIKAVLASIIGFAVRRAVPGIRK